MCGISGLFDTQGSRAYSRDLISRINNVQAHRGPDEDDVHLEPGLALGHRRLSVIDLATGKQPLFNENGTVGIVFNGEIYNYRELMSELKALGCFTEIIAYKTRVFVPLDGAEAIIASIAGQA